MASHHTKTATTGASHVAAPHNNNGAAASHGAAPRAQATTAGAQQRTLPVQKAIVISAFICCGQGSFTHNGYTVHNINSTRFSKKKLQNGTVVDNDDATFVAGYFAEINKHISDPQAIIIVSTHAPVRKRLVQDGRFFALVYPNPALKDHWMDLITSAKFPAAVLNDFKTNWVQWTKECKNQGGCLKFQLPADDSLGNHFPAIKQGFETWKTQKATA